MDVRPIALCLIWLSVGVTLAGPGHSGKRLSLAEFQVRFANSFHTDRADEMFALADAQRDLLRPAIDALLHQDLVAGDPSAKANTGDFLVRAEALARLIVNLSGDDFPLHRVAIHKGWHSDERAEKVRADGELRNSEIAYQEGRYADSMQGADLAVASYRRLGDVHGELQALHALGQSARRLTKYADAIAHHERALALARTHADRAGQGQALIDLGDVYERQKDHGEAIVFYETALKFLRIPENWRERGRALRQLGDIRVARGEFESAFDAYGTSRRTTLKS